MSNFQSKILKGSWISSTCSLFSDTKALCSSQFKHELYEKIHQSGPFLFLKLKSTSPKNFWWWNANWLQIIILAYQVAWPSGLRRWFKAPVSTEAWVRVPPLPSLIFCCVRNLLRVAAINWKEELKLSKKKVSSASDFIKQKLFEECYEYI